MLIVQISDTHIVDNGRKTLGIAPMAENLASCVAHINQFQPRPDVVLHTGDVTNSGKLAEAERAAEILEPLCCPLYIVPGNHDSADTLWSVFGEYACPSRTKSGLDYVVEGHTVRMIGLDSTSHGGAGGKLSATQLAWLEARLAEQPNHPTVIFMHHPPIKCGVLETDADGFVGADKLGTIVAKHANIERFICGHIHLPVHARWNGTIVSTAPSMGMQLGLDLTMQRESEFFLEAPGYQIHHFTPQENLITHTIYVRPLIGPNSFG